MSIVSSVKARVRARFAICPREGFFCKDGRGWFTSASNRGHSLAWPFPSTVLGAVRTAWGRERERTTGSAIAATQWPELTRDLNLGPMLALRRPLDAPWVAGHRMWPVPRDALYLEGREHVERLRPVPPEHPTLGTDEDPAREQLWRPGLGEGEGAADTTAKPLSPPVWWPDHDFVSWLCGDAVDLHDLKACEQLALPVRFQTHVTIEADTLTAQEGGLFAHDIRETLQASPDKKKHYEWAIGVEVGLPEGSPDLVGTPVTLGSDRRPTSTEALPETVLGIPPQLEKRFGTSGGSRGLRIVVVTPARFERGWLPDGPEAGPDPAGRGRSVYRGRLAPIDTDVLLRAAFVPRPLHVSGWDMVEGRAKATDRLVSPGAVYFFERADGEPFTPEDARALWLAAIGGRTDQGFGRVVPGVWNPSHKSTDQLD